MIRQEPGESQDKKRRFNILDLLIMGLILLTGLAAYFTFVWPIHFSGQIKREPSNVYAEVEMVLSQELQGWMKKVLPVGEEQKDSFGILKWKIQEIHEEESLPGQTRTVVKLKALVYLEPSMPPRYGKYNLIPGGPIIFSNERISMDGRLKRYRLLDENVAM